MNLKYQIIALIAIIFQSCSAKKFNISQTYLATCAEYTIPPIEYGFLDFFQVNSTKNALTKDNERLHLRLYVMTQRDAHILLTETRYNKWENGKGHAGRVYEIVIDGWANMQSVIRVNNWEIVKKAPGSHLLSPFDPMPVEIIQTNDGVLTVNIPGFAEPYLTYLDTNPIDIQFFSFSNYGKVSAKWFYDCPLDGYSNTTSVPEINKMAECSLQKTPVVNDIAGTELKDKCNRVMDKLEGILEQKKSFVNGIDFHNNGWISIVVAGLSGILVGFTIGNFWKRLPPFSRLN